MANRILVLGCCLAVALSFAGCSGETTTNESGQTGSLSLELDLAGGATIMEVWYRISGNQMPEMTGFIDTSAPGATASVEVFGLAPGFGYLVELRAIADDGTSAGSALTTAATAAAGAACSSRVTAALNLDEPAIDAAREVVVGDIDADGLPAGRSACVFSDRARRVEDRPARRRPEIGDGIILCVGALCREVDG